MTAAERWNKLDSTRQASLKRARTCSTLTIPGLLPAEGHTENSPLPTPYQSVGARGVNNLASKLLLTLLPPGQSPFRMQIEPKTRAELQEKQQLAAVNAKLAEYEQAVTNKIETLSIRPVLFESLKHLIVTGDVLLHMPRLSLRMYRKDQYVIQRAPDGSPLECVVKINVPADTLPAALRGIAGISLDSKETVDVYTVIVWANKQVTEWQEINSQVVPGSRGVRPIDKTEWLPLRWQAVPGQAGGRGLCEEYLGDLMSLEGLSKAIVKFAAAAAKIIFLVKPASTTSWKDVNKAESGDAVVGQKTDIETLQIEKFADFQVAKAVVDDLTIRLSHAFLLRSGTTRDAERVTAEEIRQMAQELEDVLGGVYTVLGQELQLPLVRAVVGSMTTAGELPQLPKGAAQPVIVTGFQALGRNHTVNRLRAFLTDLVAVDPQLETVNKTEIASRLGVGHGVEDLGTLLLTAEQVSANRQQAAMAEAATKSAPGVMSAAAKAAL